MTRLAPNSRCTAGRPRSAFAVGVLVALLLAVHSMPLAAQSDRRQVEFELIRATPLRADNAIDPFDYRSVGPAIAEAADGDQQENNDQPGGGQAEPAFEPEALQFSNVPLTGVFASINLQPAASETRWQAGPGPTGSVSASAALGFYNAGFSGGLQVRLETGSGWSATGLPATLTLGSTGPGSFQTRTVRHVLTRRSDGAVFSLELDVSAGSDHDMRLLGARGHYCGTDSGNCP